MSTEVRIDRFKLNIPGFIELRNSSACQSMLMDEAGKVMSRAYSMSRGEDGSPSYVADVQPGKTRAHAMVKTANAAAFHEQFHGWKKGKGGGSKAPLARALEG